MNIETLTSRLDSVKETGQGKYVARCPAHDDKSPSLAIKDCDDGRILLHCFAGCEAEDVLASIGLTFTDTRPNVIRNHLTSIRNHAAKLSKLIRPYLVRQEILDLISDFNRSKRDSEKLDLTQFSANLDAFASVLGQSKRSTSGRERPQQRIIGKLMVAYESLCGETLKIQGDEYSETDVADGPPLRFMRKALEVAGARDITDSAIRSAVKRQYKRDNQP